jgi:TolB-like protein
MLSPPKLAIMPFLLIDMFEQDEHLVAEIADLVIFELVELDIIQVTSSNISLMFNAPLSLSRRQNVLLDAHYMFEASVQKAEEKLILMARIYSQLADAYVWHSRFSLNPKEKKVGVQMIASEVNKFLLDEISPINFDLFYSKDNLRAEVQQ